MSKPLLCIDDARRMAQRRLPRLIFDFVDGAAGDETLKRLNTESIDAVRLLPRVLVNVEQRRLHQTLFAHTWGLPFGIAPMGMCNLIWPGADAMLARAAVHHDLPVCVSTAASSTLESTREQAGDNAWFQLYVGQSQSQAMDFVQRAERAGFAALVLTVDVPQVAPRRRDLRNGFKTPFRIGAGQFLDFACHPRWSLATLCAGVPRTSNYPSDSADNAFKRGESRGRVDRVFLARLREAWPRTLIVKGVLSPQDAITIRESGADAVYVSNHGGRQLDSGPPAIQMLPLVREAVGDDYPLIFDSGVRDGEGVVKALALGADFVMLGRPFLYGIGAAGEGGLEQTVALLRDQLDLTLAQLGCVDVGGIHRSVIVDP